MTFFSRVLIQLTDALHKAVPAVNHSRVMPRWRNLGAPVTPYHFMQPALVPVRSNKKV